MSPIAIGSLIILFVLLQDINGAGENRNSKISGTDYKSIMVSFWSCKMTEFVCLGFFIQFECAFLTTHCKEILERLKNIQMKYGFEAGGVRITDSLNIDHSKKVDTLSKFSIIFFKSSIELPAYLELAYVESPPMQDVLFDGKMTGWNENWVGPETVDVKFKLRPQIHLEGGMATHDIYNFPEGSIMGWGGKIIALANHFGENEVLFDPITFADKLSVDEVIKGQKKFDAEGTSQTGLNKNGKIRNIDFYNSMVSFWGSQGAPTPLELICLGFLIKPTLIFLTAHCAAKLEPPDKIKIESGGYVHHNRLLTRVEIARQEKVHPHSMFSLVYLKDTIQISSSLKLSYSNPSPGQYDFFDGTLVGWNKQNERPEIKDARMIVTKSRVLLDETSGPFPKTVFSEGSMIVRGGQIIALANHRGEQGLLVNRISSDDKLKVDEILGIQKKPERERILESGNSERGMISQIAFDNSMVSFWARKKTSEPLKLICLGIFVRLDWILLTTVCAEDLKESCDIVIESASDAIQENWSEGTQIEKIRILEAQSRFHIVYLKSPIPPSSPLKLEYVKRPLGKKDSFDGTLIGWNKDSERPETKDARIILTKIQMMLDRTFGAHSREINFDGSALLKGGNIIGLAWKNVRQVDQIGFYKIRMTDKLRLEGESEIADIFDRKRTSQEQVQISREDYENVIVIFRKKNIKNELEIVCLGALINKKWVLVTMICYRMLIPYSGITTTVGKDPQTLKVSGYQDMQPNSRFTMLSLESDTEVKSAITLFYGDFGDTRMINAKLIGWNEEGLMMDGNFDFRNVIKSPIYRICEREPYLTFPRGSLLLWETKMIAVSHSPGGSKGFYKIQFEDYLYIREVIQGIKPTEIIPLPNELPDWACKKPRTKH